VDKRAAIDRQPNAGASPYKAQNCGTAVARRLTGAMAILSLQTHPNLDGNSAIVCQLTLRARSQMEKIRFGAVRGPKGSESATQQRAIALNFRPRNQHGAGGAKYPAVTNERFCIPRLRSRAEARVPSAARAFALPSHTRRKCQLLGSI
jgi:hypothetical protein